MGKFIVNPYSGLFVSFEGIDYSGKTTQAKLLAEALQKEEYPVLHTFAPTKDYRFGALVRSIYTSENVRGILPDSLKNFFADEGYYVFKRFAEYPQKKYIAQFEKIAKALSMGHLEELPYFIQLCMTFDRYDHRTRLEIPALREGTHVVSDRDFFSAFAYGISEKIRRNVLLEMQKAILASAAIVPDIVFFLDINPETAAKRMGASGRKKERYDDMLVRVAETYREIFQHHQFTGGSTIISIDGSLSPETIHCFILRSVKKILKP